MSRGWVRATQTNNNNNGFFGYLNMITISSGQTVLRTYWNISLIMTLTNPGQYPPGSSIVRAGVAFADPTDISTTHPTPITNASSDWMDIETLRPRVVLASATQNIWQLNWDFFPDQSISAQRKNSSASNYGLWMAWEFSLSNAVAGFTIPWWSSSIDAFVNTP